MVGTDGNESLQIMVVAKDMEIKKEDSYNRFMRISKIYRIPDILLGIILLYLAISLVTNLYHSIFQ